VYLTNNNKNKLQKKQIKKNGGFVDWNETNCDLVLDCMHWTAIDYLGMCTRA
jgi:hypothetical protein